MLRSARSARLEAWIGVLGLSAPPRNDVEKIQCGNCCTTNEHAYDISAGRRNRCLFQIGRGFWRARCRTGDRDTCSIRRSRMILAAPGCRPFECVAGDRHFSSDALRIQLRHGRLRLGDHQADGPQRQRAMRLGAYARRMGDAIPHGASGHCRSARFFPAALGFWREAAVANSKIGGHARTASSAAGAAARSCDVTPHSPVIPGRHNAASAEPITTGLT
jgi:hypothetical protein